MNTWTIGLLVAVAAFAGCTDADPDTPQGVDDVPGDGAGNSTVTNGTTTQTTTGTADPTEDPSQENESQEPATNTPPTADLAADTNTGEAPLNVTFTITVGDGDGDPLSWTLEFGDGSQAATGDDSSETMHAYEAGNFTAVLTVSDGTAQANATIAISVTGGEEDSGPAVVAEDEWVIEYEDGTCHAKGAVMVPGAGLWIHDRPGEGDPPGTGFAGGGGTWLYEESNDMEGLQIGGEGPLGGEASDYTHCQNPDLLIF